MIIPTETLHINHVKKQRTHATKCHCLHRYLFWKIMFNFCRAVSICSSHALSHPSIFYTKIMLNTISNNSAVISRAWHISPQKKNHFWHVNIQRIEQQMFRFHSSNVSNLMQKLFKCDSKNKRLIYDISFHKYDHNISPLCGSVLMHNKYGVYFPWNLVWHVQRSCFNSRLNIWAYIINYLIICRRYLLENQILIWLYFKVFYTKIVHWAKDKSAFSPWLNNVQWLMIFQS